MAVAMKVDKEKTFQELIEEKQDFYNGRNESLKRILSGNENGLSKVDVAYEHDFGGYFVRGNTLYQVVRSDGSLRVYELGEQGKEFKWVLDYEYGEIDSLKNKPLVRGPVKIGENFLTGEPVYAKDTGGSLHHLDTIKRSLHVHGLDGQLKQWLDNIHRYALKDDRKSYYNRTYYAIDNINGGELFKANNNDELLKEAYPQFDITKIPYFRRKRIRDNLMIKELGITLTEADIVSRNKGSIWNRQTCIKDDKIYFLWQSQHYASSKPAYILSAELEEDKDKSIRYYLFTDQFYYQAKEGKGLLRLSRFKTEKLNDYYLMLDDKGELVFRDSPYNVYGKVLLKKEKGEVEVVSITYLDNHYEVNVKDLVVSAGKVSSDKWETTSTGDGELFYVDPYVFVIKDGRLKVFDKAVHSWSGDVSSLVNIADDFQNKRYERKKTAIFLDRDTKDVYLNDGNGAFYFVDASDFKTSSFNTVSKVSVTMEDNNGQLWCFNSNGFSAPIRPIEEYAYFSAHTNIVSYDKNSGLFEVNGVRLYLHGGNLMHDGKIVLRGLKHQNLVMLSKVEPLKCGYRSHVSVDLNKLHGDYVRVNNEVTSMYCDEYCEVYHYVPNFNLYGAASYYVHSFGDDEKTKLVSGDPTDYYQWSKYNGGRFVPLNNRTKFLIKGYIVEDWYLTMLARYGSSYIEKEQGIESYSKIKKLDEFFASYVVKDKMSLEDKIRKKAIAAIVKVAKQYGLSLTKNDIVMSPQRDELVMVILHLGNIKKRCEEDIYPQLIRDIEHYVKDPSYRLTNEEFYYNLNRDNRKAFMDAGISLERFNDFSGVESFRAVANDGNGFLKDNLGRSLFMQFYNLLGSRRNGQPGFLQFKQLETVISFSDDVDVKAPDLSQLSLAQKDALKKVLISSGKYLFKLLRKYDIKLQTEKLTITLAGKLCSENKIDKFKQIASDFMKRVEAIIREVDSLLIPEEVKEYINHYLAFSSTHIKDDFSNLPEETDVEDAEDLFICVWNRDEILTNLLEGQKTHCCVSLNNRVDAMVDYIYHNNLVLVEICSKKRGVIGQAFVYLAQSERNIRYGYDNKKHIFMVMDNIELNSECAKYADVIGRHLQHFMQEYVEYVHEDAISDVLLGTSYNDINAPYDFKASMPVKQIGWDGHYLDSRRSFHKFI